MSSYNKPITIGVGNFYTDAYSQLEESTRKFVNDQIVEEDIGVLDGENIAKGEYCVINNSHTFTTGGIAANFRPQRINDYAYNTSTTKNNSQTASIQWQDVADAGCTVKTKGGIAVITAYLYYIVFENPTTHTATNGGPGTGAWWNQVALRIRNLQTGQDTIQTSLTDNYVFAPFGGVVDTLDPGGYSEDRQVRPVMIQWSQVVGAGEFSFTPTVNPHNEGGRAAARSMTVEVFSL